MKWKKRLCYLLAAIVIVFLICITVNVYTSFLLNRELTSIRQQSKPLINAKIFRREQNAAPLYLRAAAVMHFKRSYNQHNLSKSDVASILRQNTLAIDLIRKATSKLHCQFTLVRKDVLDISPQPGLTQMRYLTELLGIQAYHEAQLGNKAAALQDVRWQYMMACHMASEPFLTWGDNAWSMQNTAHRTLAKILFTISFSSNQAHEFENSLPEINWTNYLHQILLTERALEISAIESFRKRSGIKHFLLYQASKMDEVYSLRLWKKIIQTPIPVSSDYMEKMNRRVKEVPFYAFSTQILMPLYVRTPWVYAYAETKCREREIVLALAAYHSQYHQYPLTLTPAEKLWQSTFPLDIYSKKSFRYNSDGKKFVLYSVGANRVDDGGFWKDSGNSAMVKDDIVWYR